MSWTVKNVKSWGASDGIGTTCVLYRDGKKVATCRDEATGGETEFDWVDGSKPRVDITVIVPDLDAEVKENGRRPEKFHVYSGTPEEKLLAEFANAQTQEFHGMTLRKNAHWIVSELCNAFELQKRLKKKTVFILREDGKEVEYEIRTAYSPDLKAAIEKAYGDKLVRILNEGI